MHDRADFIAARDEIHAARPVAHAAAAARGGGRMRRRPPLARIRKSSMSLLMKIACLAVYALGLAGLAGLVHGPAATLGEMVSLLLLGIHALELLFAFRFLHRYRGSMAASIALSMLFGVLHWAPLARQKA